MQKALQEAQALVDDVGEHCFKLHDEKVEIAMNKLELIAKGSKEKLPWTDDMSTHAAFDDMRKHFTTTLAKEDPQELTSRRDALTEAGRTVLHHDVALRSPTLPYVIVMVVLSVLKLCSEGPCMLQFSMCEIASVVGLYAN